MKLEIEKVKLVKGETLEVSYTRVADDGQKSNVKNESFEAPIHPDLLQCFKNLAIHLAVMCYYVKAKDVKNISSPDEKLSEGFVVRGISYGGDDDDQGITLTGHYLGDGKPVILNTPFRRFGESEQTGYKFIDDLETRLNRLTDEVEAYMKGEKRGTDPQGKIDFPETPITKAQILPPDDGSEKPLFKGGIPAADPEAMKRVAGFEEAEVISETKKKAGRPRKVAQSSENPSGEVHE